MVILIDEIADINLLYMLLRTLTYLATCNSAPLPMSNNKQNLCKKVVGTSMTLKVVLVSRIFLI